MFVALTIFSLVAIVAVVTMLLVSRRPSRPKRLRQGTAPSAEESFPAPGSGVSAHRPDGSPVPGSQEHRNRHGQA